MEWFDLARHPPDRSKDIWFLYPLACKRDLTGSLRAIVLCRRRNQLPVHSANDCNDRRTLSCGLVTSNGRQISGRPSKKR